MKRNTLFLIIPLLFWGCHKSNVLENTIWIGDYSHGLFDGEYSGEAGFDQLRKVLQFSKDSILISHFFNEYIYDDCLIENADYIREGDYLITNRKTVPDSIFILSNSQDSVVLIKDCNVSRKSVYRRLEKFNQAEKFNQMNDLLLNNTFFVNDSNSIEFGKERRVFTKSLYDYSEENLWKIDTLRTELFLLPGGLIGSIHHIKEIDSLGFRTVIYNHETHEFNYRVNRAKIVNEKSNILGKWYSEFESLIVTDSTIKRTLFTNKMRDYSWQINRENNILYIESKTDSSNKQWNILNVDLDSLIIEERLFNPIKRTRKLHFHRRNTK